MPFSPSASSPRCAAAGSAARASSSPTRQRERTISKKCRPDSRADESRAALDQMRGRRRAEKAHPQRRARSKQDKTRPARTLRSGRSIKGENKGITILDRGERTLPPHYRSIIAQLAQKCKGIWVKFSIFCGYFSDFALKNTICADTISFVILCFGIAVPP